MNKSTPSMLLKSSHVAILGSVLLFTLFLVKIDRYFLKKNSGFCLHYILSDAPCDPQWKTEGPFPREILEQPFSYLGKGSQTYVFESQDGKYVLKFYKFPSHMRKIGWLKHPFAYHMDGKRASIKKHNLDRFHLSFNSYFLSQKELQNETGVVYVHLYPSDNLRTSLHLIDKLGMHYEVPADHMGFIVQRKAASLLPTLQQAITQKDEHLCKQMINNLLQVITSRCHKGISDLDAMHHNNYGWLEGRAIHIDVGRFVYDASVKTPEGCQKEIVRITQSLSDFLAKESPELHQYFLTQLQHDI
ncbi:MAG: hypothetical protein JSR58_01115 [Verrucomicrobia bacterium]|nr:hypothetical protein [Verrucomicrobiota bacterium]